jgi:HSP20 family protein
MMAMADAMNRAWGRGSFQYDYGRNGGSNGSSNGEAENTETNGAPVRTAHLPVNAWSNEDNFFVKANLPGVNPDSVEITFDKETLAIRGEFPAMEEEVEYIKKELFSGPFERKLTFRTPINVDGIEAIFENGTLTLTVPKAEEAKPRQIKAHTVSCLWATDSWGNITQDRGDGRPDLIL